MCLSVSSFKILVQSKIVNFFCNFCCSHSGADSPIPPEKLFLMKPGVNCQAKRQKIREKTSFCILPAEHQKKKVQSN